MATTTKDLVITRVFDAPLPLVWKAWVDPEMIKQWWGPDLFTCPFAKIDFRVGGTSLVCMRAPKEFGGQDMYSTWKYTNIVPLERIEYIHNLADKDGNTLDPASIGMPADFPQNLLNAITFEDLGNGKTKVTVTEYNWPVGQMMKMSEVGKEQCLNKMATILEEQR
ncbi:MAG TPA: SRPBCC domain-containing protein [Bacteroidota bacterium]